MKTVGTSLHSLGTDPAPGGKLLRLLFLFLLINFAWFYHAGGDNENAHFDQIRAYVTLPVRASFHLIQRGENMEQFSLASTEIAWP